ncbi:hypothetical protein [Kitasatospora sp. NRRL B-11411]|uniref:hypothetical protein n=1 Tax=Kitasatospora sp. NRRL B-11411 TaxID=1463822 RepID=UPI001E4C28EF|nr:hypothetical protein [Kitasatospora sp. NRRL B-11411]
MTKPIEKWVSTGRLPLAAAGWVPAASSPAAARAASSATRTLFLRIPHTFRFVVSAVVHGVSAPWSAVRAAPWSVSVVPSSVSGRTVVRFGPCRGPFLAVPSSVSVRTFARAAAGIPPGAPGFPRVAMKLGSA